MLNIEFFRIASKNQALCSLLFNLAGFCWIGVDILNEDVADNMEKCVWEPSLVKINALSAACEATCLILSVDETIKNPKFV